MRRRILIRATSVVTGVFSVCALGAGVAAAAPDLSGQTYGKAAAQIKSWGSTPVIATVVGDQLATDDCIVTKSAVDGNLDSSGRARSPSRFLLSLNCNATLAGPGKPGNSLASPEGRNTKQDLANIAWLNQNPSENVASSSPAWAKVICEKYPGDCSQELLDFLAKSK